MLATIQLNDDAAEHLLDPKTTVVEVAVDRYPLAQLPAQGHVARPLPLDGGPAADRELLLTKVGSMHHQQPPRVRQISPEQGPN